MLGWAVFFLIVALIAALFGFGGIAGAATGIAQILFVIFLVLFVVSLLFGRRVITYTGVSPRYVSRRRKASKNAAAVRTAYARRPLYLSEGAGDVTILSHSPHSVRTSQTLFTPNMRGSSIGQGV